MSNQVSNSERGLIVIVKTLAALVVLKTVVSSLANLTDYFPPNFESDFLMGRESSFFGSYQIAFSLHVISGPLSLLFGLLLVSSRVRTTWPAWHRRIGKIQIPLVAFVVAPSGFWMAFQAVGGILSVCGFAILAVLTGGTVIAGYIAVRKNDFRQHEVWMMRCLLLLISAVVLRIIAGTAITFDLRSEWIYPASAWASWIVPLGLHEALRKWK